MRELADILIVRGVLGSVQIEEALQAQALYGGGFDTNVMEVTGLTEDRLQPLLEEVHQIRNRIDIFGVPSEDAIRLLDYPLAEKYHAVPFHLAGRVLDLIVHDPSALAALDEIAFATGCRVVVNVATEARVAWQLKQAYGVDMPLRLAQLLVRRPPALTFEPEHRAFGLPPFSPPAPGSAATMATSSAPPASLTEHAGEVSVFSHDEPAADAPVPVPAPPEARRPTRPSGEYSVVRESGPIAGVRDARPSRPPPLAPRDAHESIELPPPGRRTASPSIPPPSGAPSTAPRSEPPPSRPPPSAQPTSSPSSPSASAPAPASPRPSTTIGSSPAPDPSASGTGDYRGAVWTGTESLDAAFARVESRDEIPALLFGYLGARLERMLLFTARGGALSGWDGRGPRVRRESVEALVLPLATPSVLQGACEHGMPFLGALPFGDVEESLLVRLGGEWPQHVVLWPIRVRERTVALFYGEAVSSDHLRTTRERIEQAIACVEKTFLRLILARKRASF